ncbi:hypothetical protein RhiirA4_485742, partial [Rhizophagus irregularis]
MNKETRRIINKPALEFVSEFSIVYFHTISLHLGSFVKDGFLKTLYDKSPSKTQDNNQLLIERFGDAANPANFTLQAQASNMQPATLLLIYSIALYTASRAWDEFSSQFFKNFGDMGPAGNSDDDESLDDEHDEDEDDLILGLQTPNPVDDTPPVLPDVEMTPVDQSVIPENSRKKDKQKARITDDKQVKHQSTTANPDKVSAKNSQKEKKSSVPEVTQILTGYEAVGEEQERIRDIIVYDIPYTWDLQKILA